MIKPENYDTTEAATGDFKNIPAGGYICKIQSACVDQTKDGKEVLIVNFDIVEGDFKNYYTEQFDRKVAGGNLDTKWPGVYRQLTEGKSLPFFKGMITAIENSNQGYVWDWNESTLRGKLFGGVFGEEEYRGNDGKVHTNTKLRFIRSVEQIRNGVQIPEPKKLQGASSMGQDVKQNPEIKW